MNKQKKITGGIPCLLILIALAGCEQSVQTEQEILRPVRSIEVTHPGTAFSKTFPGVVESVQKADLSFRVSGRLSQLLVNEGEFVQPGQVIAQLDQVDYTIRFKDRQASYEVARADYERALKLVDSGAIARADVDNLKAKLGTATAQLESARQELEYTELRAPFSGHIAKRYVDNFEEVSAKQEIVALQDTSALLIKVEMPESVIAKANINRKEMLFSTTLASLPGQEFPVDFHAFSSQASDSSQTYTATFIMPSSGQQLILPGMSAQLTAKRAGEKGEEIFVPAHTVLEDIQGRYVFVATSAEDGVGIIKRRPVSIGSLTERGIQIRTGLEPGDHLITAGMSQMYDGMRVRLQPGDDSTGGN